jgi:hypothetical protein
MICYYWFRNNAFWNLSSLFFFFWRLSSGYSCSICSCTNSHQPYIRTPCVHKQTYNYTKIISRPSWDHRVHLWHRRRLARRIPFVAPRVRGKRNLLGTKPLLETRVESRIRTRAGCLHTRRARHPSSARFSSSLFVSTFLQMFLQDGATNGGRSFEKTVYAITEGDEPVFFRNFFSWDNSKQSSVSSEHTQTVDNSRSHKLHLSSSSINA